MKRKIHAVETLSEDARKAFKITEDASDIACALVISGFLDQCLGALLKAYFLRSDVADGVLRASSGFVADFDARAKLAYILGLIPKRLFQNLCLIGQVRNIFAHSHLGIKFEDEGIPGLCDDLVLPAIEVVDPGGSAADRSEEDIVRMLTTPRMKFVVHSLLMADRLLQMTRATKHPDPPSVGWESAA